MSTSQVPAPGDSSTSGPGTTPRTLEERVLRGIGRLLFGFRAALNPGAGEVPPYEVWIARVAEIAARTESDLRARIPGGLPASPAIILDIDNTALETHYHPSLSRIPATGPIRDVARLATELGIAVIFVTGRPRILRAVTLRNLRRVGYTVDDLHMRDDLGDLGDFKSGVRAEIEKRFTIIANIGNNLSDFHGGRSQRVYKLPDYNRALD